MLDTKSSNVKGPTVQLEYLIAFTTIFLIDSVSPGPATTAVMAKGTTTGWKRTLPFITGLVVGDLILFGLAVLGLAALAVSMGALFAIIKWLGIAYLLWLAWRMWHLPPRTFDAEPPRQDGWKLLTFGTLLPLGNPKAIGFYVAILPTVMDVTVIAAKDATLLALIIAIVWFGVLLGYATMADKASHLVRRPRAQRWFNRAASGSMVAAAGTVAMQ
ncbi:MAG: LysE family translocator [Pseudomonadota bacterium]